MEKAKALQVRVDLKDAKPPIWRRILLPADTTLEQMDLILQGAFGWTNSHLHGFRQGDRRFYSDTDLDPFGEAESGVTLGELLRTQKSTLTYDYDFGDDWEHTIRLEKRISVTAEQLEDLPRLLGGARACPPEDCGGIYGYEQFLERMKAKDPETLEWISSLGGSGDWSAEAFDREEHEDYMRILISGAPTDAPTWTALEEQLAWSTLDSFLNQPEWRPTWDAAEGALSSRSSFLIPDKSQSEPCVPGFRQLVRDYAAFDICVEETDPVIPMLLRAHPDLPEGSETFLRSMLLEPLAPYLVEKESADGIVVLYSLVDKEIIDVEVRPDCEALNPGDLLLARVVANGEQNVLRGQHLQSPFCLEDYSQMLDHLKMMCELDGGNVEDRCQLLKPAPPLLLALWKILMHSDDNHLLPLATYRGAKWEPGTSVFLCEGGLMEHYMSVLNRSRDLRSVSESLWMLADPDADPKIKPPHGLPGFPIAWILLAPGELHLLAGSRKALQLCRASVKKLDLLRTRYHKTSYSADLDLPLVSLDELLT